MDFIVHEILLTLFPDYGVYIYVIYKPQLVGVF